MRMSTGKPNNVEHRQIRRKHKIEKRACRLTFKWMKNKRTTQYRAIPRTACRLICLHPCRISTKLYAFLSRLLLALVSVCPFTYVWYQWLGQDSRAIEMEEAESPDHSIDESDAVNPLAVVDYIEDIHNHYKETEVYFGRLGIHRIRNGRTKWSHLIRLCLSS